MRWKPVFSTMAREMLPILTLLLCGWKFTEELESVADLPLSDEDCYLWMGQQVQNPLDYLGNEQTAQSGPLYVVWYHLLSYFFSDSVTLFYASATIITVFIPLIFYLALRTRQASIIPSLLVSGFLLISCLNVTVWPKVNHLCALIILLSFALGSMLTDPASRLFISILGGLVCSYLHPEYFVAVCCFQLVLLFVLIRHGARDHPLRVCLFLLSVAVTVASVATMGLPLFGDRSMIAFGQHFALNWIDWHEIKNLNPWLDWKSVLDTHLGQSESVAWAVAQHPGLIARHVISNILTIPLHLGGLLFDHASILLPPPYRRLEFWITFVAGVSSLLFLRRRWTRLILDGIRNHLKTPSGCC